jgi:hypothetical protein
MLVERTHYVPRMFEEIVAQTLSRAAEITGPLRDTLRQQTETGRALPQFEINELVPTTEIYTRLTGNAFWLEMSDEHKRHWIQKFRQNYAPACFDELQQMQEQLHARVGGTMSATARMYFRRMTELNSRRDGALVLRDARGVATCAKADMSKVFLSELAISKITFVRRLHRNCQTQNRSD